MVGTLRQCPPPAPGKQTPTEPLAKPVKAFDLSPCCCPGWTQHLPRTPWAPASRALVTPGAWGWLCHSQWPQPDTRTGFEDEEVQGIVTQVGCCGNLVGGDAQDQLLVVAPGEQEAACREAEDAVLLRRRLQRQLLQLLRGQNKCQGCEGTQQCRGGAPGVSGPLLPWPCPAAAAPHPGWRGSGRLSPMSGGLKTGERGTKPRAACGGWGQGAGAMHPPHPMAQSLLQSTHVHMGTMHFPGVQGDPAMGGSSMHPQPTFPLPRQGGGDQDPSGHHGWWPSVWCGGFVTPIMHRQRP